MSNSCKYYTERTLGWMLNNKIIVFLSLLSFCLFVSTLAMAGQRNRLWYQIYDLTSTEAPATPQPTPAPTPAPTPNVNEGNDNGAGGDNNAEGGDNNTGEGGSNSENQGEGGQQRSSGNQLYDSKLFQLLSGA
ncbi:hypothetical protein B5X24_HaOG202361 [Helicoverpa armigera]|nr:hypothetical protein B5X24_HaOG202361 [Helicoverpa armigera]